ncbi:MAG: alpha/beta hydrolase [Dongiaceae bacterium]
MSIASANGVELAWDSFGADDGEAVLLIAGLGTQMIRWTAPFCTALAECGYRVIRFDNRDAGCSTHLRRCEPPDLGALATALMSGQRPEVPYTLADMSGDAVGLLDALAIGRAHVVGRSMGGMIAQIMASEHPERVRSLTSIMAGTGNPALPQAAPDVMAMMTSRAPDPVSDEAGFLAHSLDFARRIAGSGHPLDEPAHRALVLQEIRRAHDPGGAARQIAAMAVTGDRRSRLATIAAPTLVVHGTEDPLILPACGEDTAASIPDAELMLVDGMGHDLPHALHRMVVEAIDRTARRPRRCIPVNPRAEAGSCRLPADRVPERARRP